MIKYSTWSQDPTTASAWTTDEKILLSKFNLAGLDLKDMLKKYFDIKYSLGLFGWKVVGDVPDTAKIYDNGNSDDGDDVCDLFTVNGIQYVASLNNLKQNIFPDLNTNVMVALDKIMTGEGVVQVKPVTIHEVISTTPITVSTKTTPTSSIDDMDVQRLKDIATIAQLTPTQQAAIKTEISKGSDVITALNNASLTTSQAAALNVVAKGEGAKTDVIKATAITTITPPTQPITEVSITKDYTKQYLIGGGVLILVIGAVLILKK